MALSFTETRYYPAGGFASPGITEAEFLALAPSSQTSYPLKVTFTWNATQDVVNNKSDFTYSVVAEALPYRDMEYLDMRPDWLTGSCHDLNEAKYGKTIFDTTTSLFLPNCKLIVGTGPKVLSEGTFSLVHKSNGTNSVSMGLTIPCVGGYKDVSGVKTKVFELATGASYGRYEFNMPETVLDTIARHAVLYTVPAEFTDEDTVPIEYAVPSGLTGYIYMSLDGNVNTETTHIENVTGKGTKNYKFTQADLDKIWKIQDDGLRDKSIKFCIRSVSNIDGVTYREHLTSTLKLINYDPELHIEVYDVNTDVIERLTDNRDVLVRFLSNAYCKTGAKAVKGSTINTESVKCVGETRYGPVNIYEGVKGNVFDFAVVDNHGNTNTDFKDFPVETGKFIEYVKPTANVSVTEVTGDGKVAITVYGKYYKGGFGKVDNKLKITWSLQEHNQPYDSGVFEDVYVDTDEEDNYSYTFQRTGLNYLDVYELSVGVSDVAVPTEVYAEAIIAAVPVFDWGRQDFAFNVPVTIQGASVPSIVEQGTNYTGWTYRKWSDGFAECWLTKELTSVKIQTASGNGYSSGAISASNVSFPVTFTARPTVIATLMANGNPAFLSPSTTAATTEQTGTYQLNSMSSVVSKNYLITYDVKGRWK